jgi:hypothetical protein
MWCAYTTRKKDTQRTYAHVGATFGDQPRTAGPGVATGL